MRRRALTPTVRLWAIRAPFASKEALRALGLAVDALACPYAMGTAARCGDGARLKWVASDTQLAAPYAQRNSG